MNSHFRYQLYRIERQLNSVERKVAYCEDK